MTPYYDDQLVVINLSLVFILEPPSCSCLYLFIYLHVLHFVINVMLVVLRLNDVCFHIHVNAPAGHFPFMILCNCGV
jgi:hypothetical protein